MREKEVAPVENYRKFYEFEAEVYRTTVESEPAALNRLRLVRSLLPRGKINLVLDAGCGDGVLLEEFCRRKYARVVGLDLAFQRVQSAKQSLSKPLYIEGDLYCLPFRDGLFDLVTCVDLLEHLIKPQEGLSELLRVTRRYLILTVPFFVEPEKTLCPHCCKEFYLYGHLQTFTKDRLLQMVESTGGKVLSFKHQIPHFECRRYRYFPPLKWLLWGHFKKSGTLGVLIEKV